MSIQRTNDDSDAPHIYSYDYYQRLHDLEQRHWWPAGLQALRERLLLSRFDSLRGLRVLDAGCGTGGVLSWLERYHGNSEAVGLEISAHALEFCRGRRLERLVRGSVTDLPFPDEHFDLAVCLDVVQHLPRDGSETATLKELRRVLRPGGVLYLRTNNDLENRHAPGQELDEDYHRYRAAELGERLREAGLDVDLVTPVNMLPAIAGSTLRKLKPSRGRRAHDEEHGHDHGLTMRVPPAPINWALKQVIKGESWYLTASGRALPYGHSLVAVAARPCSAGGSDTETRGESLSAALSNAS